MKASVRTAILLGGIAWGVVLLIVGVFASFSIGANDTKASVVGLLLVFGLPIIASIAARWIPSISGIALFVGAAGFLVGIYASGGIMDVLRVLERVYLWFQILFGILFIALGRMARASTRSS